MVSLHPSAYTPTTSVVVQCSVLLFAIGGDTLSVASMVEAAYYMGRGRRLVLVLSDIPQPPQPGNCTAVEGMQVRITAAILTASISYTHRYITTIHTASVPYTYASHSVQVTVDT